MSTFTNEQLALAAQAGDGEALLQLWKQTKRFCLWRARRWNGRGIVDADDFAQAGFEALCETVKTFSTERGSFLDWFDYGLRKAFFCALYGSRTKRAASDPIHAAVSLDAPISDADDGGTLEDIIADDAENAFDRVEHVELAEAVRNALRRLSPEERQVIQYRFWGGLTQSETALMLHKTLPEEKRIEAAALRRLRHPNISKTLREYL